jgi:hypothetical protein
VTELVTKTDLSAAVGTLKSEIENTELSLTIRVGMVRFYGDAEELAKLPRIGVPMILRDLGDGKAQKWRYSSLNHVVARLRKKIEGVPSHFTLDACRHGGMTELEEAELTDGQGRALSTHKTQQSYEGYAKRTAARMLSATRRRHAQGSRTKRRHPWRSE